MSIDEARVSIDTQSWEACLARISEFGELLSERLDDAFYRILAAWEPVRAALQNQYTALGAPYGDTHEGLMRWLREAGEARRLRAQTEAIERRWREQADLREWGRRMRERREKASPPKVNANDPPRR